MANSAVKPLSFWQILKEALKILRQNPGVLLPLLLISFLFSSVIYLTSYYTALPLLTTLSTKAFALISVQPFSPEFYGLLSGVRTVLRELSAIETTLLGVSFVVSSLITAATIYFIAMTYSGKRLSLADVLSSIKTSWKGPMITLFYVTIFTKISLFFILFSLVFFVFIFSDSPALILLVVLLYLLEAIISLYLYVILLLGTVVSVMDPACYGIAAIAKGAELIRGKRWQGLRIALITTALAVLLGVVSGHAQGSPVSRLVAAVLIDTVSVVYNMLILAVIIVFYYECRKSHGKEEDIGTDEATSAYVGLLPGDSHGDPVAYP